MTVHQAAQLEVRQEVAKQVRLWGQKHDLAHKPHDWIAIMVRELAHGTFPSTKGEFRAMCRKVAAVAISAMAWCDNGG